MSIHFHLLTIVGESKCLCLFVEHAHRRGTTEKKKKMRRKRHLSTLYYFSLCYIGTKWQPNLLQFIRSHRNYHEHLVVSGWIWIILHAQQNISIVMPVIKHVWSIINKRQSVADGISQQQPQQQHQQIDQKTKSTKSVENISSQVKCRKSKKLGLRMLHTSQCNGLI